MFDSIIQNTQKNYAKIKEIITFIESIERKYFILNFNETPDNETIDDLSPVFSATNPDSFKQPQVIQPNKEEPSESDIFTYVNVISPIKKIFIIVKLIYTYVLYYILCNPRITKDNIQFIKNSYNLYIDIMNLLHEHIHLNFNELHKFYILLTKFKNQYRYQEITAALNTYNSFTSHHDSSFPTDKTIEEL
jgi:hypothetical protein